MSSQAHRRGGLQGPFSASSGLLPSAGFAASPSRHIHFEPNPQLPASAQTSLGGPISAKEDKPVLPPKPSMEKQHGFNIV